MSGPEIIGVISGTIAIIDATIKVCRAASDSAGLPSAFRDISSRLPLVNLTLQTALDELDGSGPDRLDAAPLSTLKACKAKTEELARLVNAAVVLATDSRTRRYWKAVNAVITKGQKAEALMQGILADLQVLTASHIVKTPTTRQASDTTVLKNSGATGSNGRNMSFRNSGSGAVIVYSGEGDQNVNAGGGPQIKGPVEGPFYFGCSGR